MRKQLRGLTVLTVLTVVTALMTSLGACSSGGSGGGNGGGSQMLAPASAARGWTTQTMGPILLSTPDDWKATAAPSVGLSGPGAQGWGFVAPAAEGQSTNGVTVIRTPHPSNADVLQVARDGAVTASRQMPAHDAKTESLSWPGAQDAAYTTYLADVPPGPGDGDVKTISVRFESLVLRLPDGSQVLVMAYGPVDRSSASDVHAILATVQVA